MTVGVTLVEEAQADRTDLLMMNESGSLGVSHSKEFPAFGKSMTTRASWASGLGLGGLSFRASLFVGLVEQGMMPDGSTDAAGCLRSSGAGAATDSAGAEADQADVHAKTEVEAIFVIRSLEPVAVRQKVFLLAVEACWWDIRF